MQIAQIKIPQRLLDIFDERMDSPTRSFFIQLWNSFFGFIAPIFTLTMSVYFSANDVEVTPSTFFTWDFLKWLLMAVIISVLGGSITGIGKATRKQAEIGDMGYGDAQGAE